MKLKALLNITLTLSCYSFANSSFAVDNAFEHQLQEGQSGGIFQIFAKLQELADQVSNLSNSSATTTYDYKDYIPAATITNKLFTVSGGNGSGSICEDTESRTYSRIVNGVNTNTDVTLVKSNSINGRVCRQLINHYIETPTAYELTGLDNIVPDGTGTVQATVSYQPALIKLTADMMQGNLSSFHTVYTDTYIPFNSVFKGALIETFEIVGVESVTVPAGTFNDCIKLNIVMNGSVPRQRISWRCPGVGMVKQVQTNTSSTYKIWELTSMTP